MSTEEVEETLDEIIFDGPRLMSSKDSDNVLSALDSWYTFTSPVHDSEKYQLNYWLIVHNLKIYHVVYQI